MLMGLKSCNGTSLACMVKGITFCRYFHPMASQSRVIALFCRPITSVACSKFNLQYKDQPSTSSCSAFSLVGRRDCYQYHRDDLLVTLKRIIAGGLAGMIAKTVVAPVDRIKILFQVTNEKFSFRKVPLEVKGVASHCL